MNYTNNSSRLQIRSGQEQTPVASPETILSLESGKHGLCLRVRKVSTAARRKLGPFKLAAVGLLALAAGARFAQAQLGFDPFPNDSSRAEASWSAGYTTADVNGINRPTVVSVNGANTPVNTGLYNFGVSSTSGDPASVLGSGNIYSPTSTLTLKLTSSFAPASGTFKTIVFSIKTLGNPLDAANVLLTTSGGAVLSPAVTFVTTSGSGMGATANYAFQYDLSGVGGANNFTISVPGSARSVSFSRSQFDASTTTYGSLSVVPEPSTVTSVFAGALGVAGFLTRRRSRLAF